MIHINRKKSQQRIVKSVARAALCATPAVLACSFLGTSAKAADLSWDQAGVDAATPGVLGGSGNWDSSTMNWYNGSADVAWTDANNAIFADGGGNVTLADSFSPSPSAVSFTSNYTLWTTAVGPTFGNLNITNSAIDVSGGSSVVAKFNAALTGTGPLVKTGDGTLFLNGTNNYSGGTTLNSGTGILTIGADGALGSGGLRFDGGTLMPDGDRSVPNATVIGAGGANIVQGTVASGARWISFAGALSGSGQIHVVNQSGVSNSSKHTAGATGTNLGFTGPWRVTGSGIQNQGAGLQLLANQDELGDSSSTNSITLEGGSTFWIRGSISNGNAGTTGNFRPIYIGGNNGGTLAVTGNINMELEGTTCTLGPILALSGTSGDFWRTSNTSGLNAGNVTVIRAPDVPSTYTPSIDIHGILNVKDKCGITIAPRTTGGPVGQYKYRNHPVYVQDLRLNNGVTSNNRRIDINDNDLVIDYTGTSPFTNVTTQVAAGRDAGAAGTFSGIMSTTSNNWSDAAGHVLALIDNADSLVGGAYTEWPVGSGHTIDSTTVIGKYTFIGDADLDGQVGSSDYLILDTNRGQTGLSLAGSWIKGDMDHDGAVGTSDYLLLDTYRGSGSSDPLAPASLSLQSVPEPGALSLLGVGLLGMLRRKKREK